MYLFLGNDTTVEIEKKILDFAITLQDGDQTGKTAVEYQGKLVLVLYLIQAVGTYSSDFFLLAGK